MSSCLDSQRAVRHTSVEVPMSHRLRAVLAAATLLVVVASDVTRVVAQPPQGAAGLATPPRAALAPAATPPAATPLATPRRVVDEVRTNEGGLVRGVIVELVPDHHVVIQTSGGSVRRFEWAQVSYAGPIIAPDAPTAPVAPPAASAPPVALGADADGLVSVQFASPGVRPVQIHVDPRYRARAWLGSWIRPASPICRAPCQFRIAPGFHRLGVAPLGGAPTWSSELVEIRSPVRLTSVLRSRRAGRLLGTLSGVVAMAAGTTFLLRAVLVSSADSYGPLLSRGALIGGGLLIASGLGVTIGIGIGLHDRVRFQVSPL
jgi:hypothetical protein